MSVKITKRGITKAEKHYRGTCSGCGSCGTEIECLGSDLKTYTCDSRDPRERDYDYVSCPVCGRQITNLKEFTPKPEINDPREYGYRPSSDGYQIDHFS